jgi:hypothetical protein
MESASEAAVPTPGNPSLAREHLRGPGGPESPARMARRMWTLFEPVHVVTYFSAEARLAFEDAGLRGFWRGYFAGRSAPLGRVAAAPVRASFYTFAPAMVSRALPAVWDLISPDEALVVRLTSDGAATPDGTAYSASIEDRTDAAAAKLIAALTPISAACAAEMPFPNPIGLRAGRTEDVR